MSGDLAVVLASGTRTVLVAIDGLGHGPEAAHAASRAAEVIEQNPAEPLDVLLLLAHRELAESRGAAATVAIVDGERGTLQWLGVGNVDGILARADLEARPRFHGAFLVGGVLGHHMGHLHMAEPLALADGDLLVLATDGIRVDLTEVVRRDQTIDRLANTILSKYGRPDDDALVVVAQFRALEAAEPDDTDYTRDARWQSSYGPLNRSAGARPGGPHDDSIFGPLGPSSTT